MGTWGTGHFENDDAGQFLDAVIQQLHMAVEDCLSPNNLGSETFLEYHGNATMMPALDVLITLCERYSIHPQLDEQTVYHWKAAFLQRYDDTVHNAYPAQYIPDRRHLIEQTFNKLAFLAR